MRGGRQNYYRLTTYLHPPALLTWEEIEEGRSDMEYGKKGRWWEGELLVLNLLLGILLYFYLSII